MNIKCLVCEAELELPLYIPGVGYKARVGCPGCKSLLYVEIDNSGNIIEYKQSGKAEEPPEEMPDDWWDDWSKPQE